jgi:RNase P/RNase MRP subunit POP5
MKALKPSAREKKRYLLVEGKNLKQNIEKAILEFVGILGMSKVGLSFIESHSQVYPEKSSKKIFTKGKDNSAIICINREMVDNVRASFCVFPEKIEVKKVSGTLKGLRK